MDSLNSVVHNAVQRAFLKAYLERLEELSGGTILGEIFNTFSFTPAFLAVFDGLEEVDTDDHEKNLEYIIRDDSEDLHYDLLESKTDIEGSGEDIEHAHRHLMSYCDPEDYYGSSLFQIENTAYTAFDVSGIQETIADYVGDLAKVAVAESLGGSKGSSDDELKVVWSNAIQNICEIECGDEPYDRICQVFRTYL